MAKFDQFGSAAPGQGGSTRDCLRYEAMLAEVIDGTLPPEDQAAFDLHQTACDSCSSMLKDARTGAAWMQKLKPFRPEPPATLVDRILAETSVRAAREAEAVRAAQRAAAEATSLLGSSRQLATLEEAQLLAVTPSPEFAKVLPFRNRLPASLRPALNTVLQTRFAMTAAMAFFSVAVTLNLTGVHLSDLHARDLRPASLRRNFYEANAHVVRYYENLRVVYELESRVRDLQHSSDSESSPGPAAQQAPTVAAPAAAKPVPAPAGQPASPSNSPQPRPSGKPRSGLSTGAGTPQPGARDSNPGIAGHHSNVVAPQGAILPVSLSQSTLDRQKRGLA